MSDLMIILLCVTSYMIGGLFGMGALVLLRQAKRVDRAERVVTLSKPREYTHA